VAATGRPISRPVEAQTDRRITWRARSGDEEGFHRPVTGRFIDLVLHRTAVRGPHQVRGDVLAFHRSIPVVDLLVGTALFHRDLLRGRPGGHADLPRLLDSGVDLIGLSIATRFPDLRGTLSAPHFRLLGLRAGTNMELVEALMRRIEGWAAASGGRLRMVRSGSELGDLGGPGELARGLDPGASVDGPVGGPMDRPVVRAFIGVQGGHVLDGDPTNIDRLATMGVRMFGLGHVMDNELVGSGTGVRRGGLTPAGREVVERAQAAGILVDLAHVSLAGIEETLPLLRRSFVVSHTGLHRLARGRSRWRRYSPATRNLSDEQARAIVGAGGVIGLTLSTQLLGVRTVGGLVDAIRAAVDLVGTDHLALGSDFDGALPMVLDVSGLPLLTQALLDGGFGRSEVAAIMGGNALRVLREAWS
jgi:membrane dipeptidase